MTDSDTQDNQVLGKRARQGEVEGGVVNEVTEEDVKNDGDDSDDDLGPMPLPATEEAESTKKKKRKGMFPFIFGAVQPSKVQRKNPPAFSVSSSAS